MISNYINGDLDPNIIAKSRISNKFHWKPAIEPT